MSKNNDESYNNGLNKTAFVNETQSSPTNKTNNTDLWNHVNNEDNFYLNHACNATVPAPDAQKTYYIMLGASQFAIPLVFITIMYVSLVMTFLRDER